MKKLLLLFLLTFVGIQAQEHPLSLWKLGNGIIDPADSWTVKFATPFTLGSTSVTATGTQLNYLAGATGTTGTTTTNLVFSTSPVLVTPTLGVAQGTSLALGGATIGTNALAVTGTGYFSGNVKIGINDVSDANLESDDSFWIDIDKNNNNTDRLFGIRTNSATELFRVQENGFTGVGYTADPTSGNKFAVSGNSYFNGTTTSTGAFLAPTNSAASPSYSFTNDTNTGIYRKGADTLGIATNGTNVITVAGTNVGIGTTGPLWKLSVNGTAGFGTVTEGIVMRTGTDFASIAGQDIGDNAYNDLYLLAGSHVTPVGMVIKTNGNVGIGTSTPLHKTSIASPTTANYFYGLNIVNANINKTRTTIVQSTDTADVNIKISTLGNPQFMMKGATGNTIFLVDSSATSLGNALTLLDPGTSANSYAITLTADNATTPQLAQLYNAYGASPYIVVAPSNGAGTPTPAIYIHSDAMNFIDSYSLTTNTADDDNVIFKAVDNDDNVLYEVARLTGAATPTFDLLAGRLTGALNANSQDISSVNALGAVSLTLTGAFTGSSLTDGNDTFTTTATADTVTISGASVNDRYYGNYTTAVTAAESPLSIVATATGFIATRPIGTTSDAAYNWFRIKH